MKKNVILTVIGLLISIPLILSILIYKDFSSEYIYTVIFFGIFIIAFYIYFFVKNKKIAIQKDELSIMIRFKSIRNSWVATYFLISGMSLLHFFNIIDLDFNFTITYIIIGMNSVYFISLLLYKKSLANK
jgi:hypothetical protein